MSKVKAPVKKPEAKKEESSGPQLSSEDKANILSAIEWLTKQGVWFQLPSATQKFIEKYGNWKIHTSMVTRKPVNKLTEYVTNLIVEKKLQEFKATAGYDEYYHLGAVLFLMDDKTNQIKTLQYEKLDRPTLREVPANQEFQSKILVAHRPITLAEAVKKHVEHMSPAKYYTYNAFSENCQNFLMGFYKALDESTPTLESFILQPLDELLKTLPEYSKSLTNIITNLGATTNNWLEYFGFKPLIGGSEKSQYIKYLLGKEKGENEKYEVPFTVIKPKLIKKETRSENLKKILNPQDQFEFKALFKQPKKRKPRKPRAKKPKV
jgi:hypothetical protein